MIAKLESQHAAQRLYQQRIVAMSSYLAQRHGRPDYERKQQEQRLLVCYTIRVQFRNKLSN